MPVCRRSSHSLVARKTNVDHTAIATRHLMELLDLEIEQTTRLTIQSSESEMRTALDRSYMACVRVSKITGRNHKKCILANERDTYIPKWQFPRLYTRWQSSAAGGISARMCWYMKLDTSALITHLW